MIRLGQALMLILRIGFGAIWVYAGVVKIADPAGFLADVRGYQLLGDPWAAAVALVLPWVEVVAGLAVVVGRWLYRGSLALLAGALVAFAVGLASAWARGLDIDCGCFGGDEAGTNYPWWIARDFLLLGWAALLWWWDGRLRGRR